MLLTSLLTILLTRSFKPFVFEGNYQVKLDFEALDDLGLYVHIPFCRSLCGFCPYCKEKYDKQRADSYKTALLKEIDLVCEDMAGRKSVPSLYFGGGTPALMIDDLRYIIDKLKSYFLIEGGIGVELHPSDISEGTLQKLKSAGVTMVSVGIQSFNADCLHKLGRSSESFTDKLDLVSEFGFDVVDVDLIFAMPGQTNEILANDITSAFDHGATQVSAYPFTNFTFADNKYKPMSKRVKRNMLARLSRFSSDINVDRTSVWTFAQRGTEKYSSVTREAFLGFGPSATTLLKDVFKINTFSVDAYEKRINAGSLPTSLTVNFTMRQRAVYYLFWGAYSMKINGDKFEKITRTPLNKMFGLEFFVTERLGFTRRNGNTYELTDKGAFIYHDIEQFYTTTYIDKVWNVSGKQAFPDKITLR
jgi:menaquinone C8-methyltransferase